MFGCSGWVTRAKVGGREGRGRKERRMLSHPCAPRARSRSRSLLHPHLEDHGHAVRKALLLKSGRPALHVMVLARLGPRGARAGAHAPTVLAHMRRGRGRGPRQVGARRAAVAKPAPDGPMMAGAGRRRGGVWVVRHGGVLLCPYERGGWRRRGRPSEARPSVALAFHSVVCLFFHSLLPPSSSPNAPPPRRHRGRRPGRRQRGAGAGGRGGRDAGGPVRWKKRGKSGFVLLLLGRAVLRIRWGPLAALHRARLSHQRGRAPTWVGRQTTARLRQPSIKSYSPANQKRWVLASSARRPSRPPALPHLVCHPLTLPPFPAALHPPPLPPTTARTSWRSSTPTCGRP